jgi:hypothetical protein
MKKFRCLLSVFPVLVALCLMAPPRAAAVDDLVISEIMALNDGILPDEDGDFPDWIEIYNAGTNSVDLNGWYLTDNLGALTKWRFPATNMPPNGLLIVYASDKDKRVPGRPLHTSFKLGDNGSVALVRPDGMTVASAFAPYPQQVEDISYGVPTTQLPVTFVSTGGAARFTVPLNDALGAAWLTAGFNDSSWAAVTNGVGFEATPPAAFTPAIIADSVAEFTGTQGQSNWFYGYWDRKADGDGSYAAGEFIAFPRGTGNTLSSTNYWDGSKWDWPAGNPPFTELTASGGTPAGDNGVPARAVHWTIRRYVSEASGPVRITGTLAYSGSNYVCGDGVIARILVDGAEVMQQPIQHASVGYSIAANVSLGSFIDFVLDAGAGNNDDCDATTFTAVVRTFGEASVVADSFTDFSGQQGHRNWSYGHYNVVTDTVPGYHTSNFVAFPSGAGPHSAVNYWDGAKWDWFDGDPPYDEIGPLASTPNISPVGGANGQQHWVIRRWVSEVSGTLHIDWHVGKQTLAGGGVTAKVFQNGTQRDTVTLGATDFAGATRTVVLTGVAVGDFIDFTLEPGADIIGDSTFLNAVIFGSGSLSNQFVTDVGGLMTNLNATAYLRLPFVVTPPADFNTMTLRVKSDDGFAAYLNGILVASRNAPESPLWNSTATAAHPDADSAQFEDYTLGELRDLVVTGTNVLAIQGLNVSAADGDFLLAAELKGTRPLLQPGVFHYFVAPTPGVANGVGNTNVGPRLTRIDHAPHEPVESEDLFVTARAVPTFNSVTNVRLTYRVAYGTEVNVTMLDDGLHADGVAGDFVFGATIPASAYTNGQMIRYYLVATDSQSRDTRQPPYADTNNSPQYFGTVAGNPTLTNPLPALHLFCPNLATVEGSPTALTKCSLYFRGEFYDNCTISRHGQSSGGFRMKSFDVDFNPGHNFRWRPGESRVDDINLLQVYSDKSFIRNILGYGTHGMTGIRSPTHYVEPVRVQSNTVFHGIMNIVENGDANYVDRIGRDPNGAFYKLYEAGTAVVGSAEKKTRRNEDKSDLQDMVNNTAAAESATRRTYLFDNVDVSEVVDYLAAMSLTHNQDCCHKNFYYYRDTEGDREWEMMPWDVDLAFGRNWQSVENYFDDRTYTNNGVQIGGNATLPGAIFGTPVTQQMFRRRYRTLMDTILQTNGTSSELRVYENWIDQLVPLHAPDGLLHLAKWGSWGAGNQGIFDTNSAFYKDIYEAADEIKNLYLPGRRGQLFSKSTTVGANVLPDAQPTNIFLRIGTVEFNPASGNQDEEYIQIINTNAIYVDISGWQLTGAVQHVFQAGTVIPPPGATSSNLYVVRNKKAFRARATGPRGGQQLYIEGPYDGQLSARGETLYLVDTAGRVVNTNLYVGAPSGPQRWLRITELMYHPPNPASGPYEAEDYEYIELRNTGPTNISLVGVQFVGGVEFNFTGGAVTSLASGAHVLVVRNLAAFASRYPTATNVAGQYVGILNNGGENIRLIDAVGENILDFDYDNAWYPITDGPGASLVIINDMGEWQTWKLPSSWRPSFRDFGSPGAADPVPAPVRPVLVNELLANSMPPLVDHIELFNPDPANAADISGWFLSDDFATPKKYSFPPGTTLLPGEHRAFDENQFNPMPGVPPSFSFSSFGDEAWLFSGDGTNLTGYLHGEEFGATETDVTLGRHTNSQGAVHFVAQSTNTFDAANALPKVGPIVLTEIMYHPPDLPGGVDNQVDEYVELLNLSGATVPLHDPMFPTNRWRLRGGIDFDFPANSFLSNGVHAYVVSFNPTNTAVLNGFRNRYQVPPDAPVFGPFTGKLDNSSDTVSLLKPGTPGAAGTPFILVDRVEYSDDLPWPAVADGVGAALQRLVPGDYGNDVTNWVGVAPSPGSPFVGGTPPAFTSQPASVTRLFGQAATFSVTVSGTPPFIYQWRFKGTNIYGATASMLVLSNVNSAMVGAYDVIVFNQGGSAQSSNATLSVLLPVSIAQQPTNVLVRVRPDPNAASTTNATFHVAASTTNPGLRYQWRFNGTNLVNSTNIAGATNVSLTISNVQVSDGGLYDCVAQDDVSQAVSGAATLIPLVTTVIVQGHLVSHVVLTGAPVTFSVAASGHPMPLSFEWRLGSTPLVTNTVFATNDFFVRIAPMTLVTNQLHRVIVKNLATTGNNTVATNYITTVIDSDGDGLPDFWENAFNATDPNADDDGDGMKNGAEYGAGTDPTSTNSFLRIEMLAGGAGATLSFAGVSNKTYTILGVDRLGASAATWSRVADFVARPANFIGTATDPDYTTNRFYQVVTPRRP